MMSGKQVRLNKIFRGDGKAVVVAMDHASGMGPLPGIVNPEGALKKIVAGGADAMLTTAGIIRRFGNLLPRMGLILRADGGSTSLGTKGGMGKLFGPDMALSLGADAICTMGFAGPDDEYACWTYVAGISQECQIRQLPYLVEALARGPKVASMPIEDALATACRVASEYGADFIKTAYPGTPEGMQKMVNSCYSPILILGGNKMDTDRALLETVRGAMDGGASGVCMGRNVWQHKNPDVIVAAICEIVHGGKSVDEVVKQL